MNNLPHCDGKDFNKLFAGKNPVAVDLIRRMLTFDPQKRITVDEALSHEYLSKLHDEEDEPVSEKMCFYDFQFELKGLDTEDYKKLIYEEAMLYHDADAVANYLSEK